MAVMRVVSSSRAVASEESSAPDPVMAAILARQGAGGKTAARPAAGGVGNARGSPERPGYDLAPSSARLALRAGAAPPRYPSTVLMTAVLARVAGVPHVTLCVPPDADGSVAGPTLAAAAMAGVDEVYRVGGAQAIGAMAYGTETIEAVDVIVGPGNVYVSEGKRQGSG